MGGRREEHPPTGATGQVEREAPDQVIQRLHALVAGSPPVFIGTLPERALHHWSHRVGSDDVFVTAGRRRHYASEHPEVIQYERAITLVVTDPDRVQRFKSDPMTVNLIWKVAPGVRLLVGVRLARKPHQSALVNTLFIASPQFLTMMSHFVVWERDK